MQGQSESAVWEASVASWSWKPQRWGELTARSYSPAAGEDRLLREQKVKYVVGGSEDVGD